MKRTIAFLLAIMLLTFSGCTTIVLGNGTLEYNANDVDHIKIESSFTGKFFTVSDREAISSIVNYINSFDLNMGSTVNTEDYRYGIYLIDHLNGGAEYNFTVVNNESVIHSGMQYNANTKDFLQYLEALECDMLTDNELIDSLLDNNTLERLNVLNEEGKLSLDKIVSLPKTCPALFELLSRPSGIASVAGYGVEKIEGFLNSNNPELMEKAEEWIEVLKKLVPEAKENLENILETYKKSENNP